jgi:carotenoid cleavage dioxygenase-like enzyme
MRVVLDLNSGAAAAHRLARRTLEFPSVNPDWHGRPHSHVYCGGDAADDDVFWWVEAAPVLGCKRGPALLAIALLGHSAS